jgi:hypothetical protein
MFTRILIASAAFAALSTPSVQAASLFDCFFLPHADSQKQCAFNVTHNNSNKARIDQDQWGPGVQFGLQFQDGNNNRAYTGQKGTDEVAVTIQKGNDNGAFTHQEGTGQISVTVQNGTGLWAGTSSIGDGTITAVSQTN